jgi:signal transduction histidine kinase
MLLDVIETCTPPTTDRFLAMAAHELRAPLSRLYGHLELLESLHSESALTDALLERSLGRMNAAVTGMTGLLNDLMQIARTENGQLHLRRLPLPVAEVVVETVAAFAENLPRIHQFLLDVDYSVGDVELDRTAFERILLNLLENAVKYSPRGGTIRVSVKSAADGVAIEVGDEGIGLPTGTVERIWAAYGRAPNADAVAHGLGLGLHISQRLVTAHGGRLSAESAGENQGTTMRVWLPTASSSAPGL